MLLFSATFEDSVWKFAERVIPDPNIIKLRREEETLDNIKQYYVLCKSKGDKFNALCNVYGAITIAQAMIFCRVSLSKYSQKIKFIVGVFCICYFHLIVVFRQTRKTANWLAGQMSEEGHQVGLLNGEMTVVQRAAVIERFKVGKEKVLITTNVCARGEGI